MIEAHIMLAILVVHVINCFLSFCLASTVNLPQDNPILSFNDNWTECQPLYTHTHRHTQLQVTWRACVNFLHLVFTGVVNKLLQFMTCNYWTVPSVFNGTCHQSLDLKCDWNFPLFWTKYCNRNLDLTTNTQFSLLINS